jgi:hypothetical protein
MLAKDSAMLKANKLDKDNFENVSKAFGALSLLPDDVEKLYIQFHETIGPHLITPKARTAGVLFVLCRKHLTLGALSLFRLYSAQMYRESRAAIEAAGIARLIQVDPAAFKVFNEDDLSEEARKKSRKTFAPAKLFPKDKPQMHVLSDFYDTASRLSHTSGVTFVRHLTQPSGGTAQFSYQDIIATNVPHEFPIHLLSLCQTHLTILTAADEIFADIKADMEHFRREREVVFQRMARFFVKYRNTGPTSPPSSASPR